MLFYGDEAQTETAPPARDLSKDVLLQGKIRAMQVFAAAITGETPQVVNRGEYVEVIFTPRQKTLLQGWIKKSLTAAPGDVRIDYYGVAMPPLVQVYGKLALAVLLISFFLGRLTK